MLILIDGKYNSHKDIVWIIYAGKNSGIKLGSHQKYEQRCSGSERLDPAPWS